MVVTITLYDHTAVKFADGSFTGADSYAVKLLTAATFNAADVTLADTGGTEPTAGSGYTAGGQELPNVSVSTVTTNDAKFDADDVVWTASGGTIAASYAIIYNDSTDDADPVAFIDFGGSQSASDGTNLVIVWDANGIFTWTVA